MTPRMPLLRGALLFATAALAVAAVVRAGQGFEEARRADRQWHAVPGIVTRWTREEFRALEARTIRGAPFLLAGDDSVARPADLRTVVEPAATTVRPALGLQAIVGGPPWQAVVTGLPGTDGSTVVRVGDAYPPLAIRRIDVGRVVIRGRDTTWTLALPPRVVP